MGKVIENVGRGLFKITDRGQMILAKSPATVNVKYLGALFPDYRESIGATRKKSVPKIGFSTSTEGNDRFLQISDEDYVKTPEELIESGYQKIKKSLEEELLTLLKTVHPSFFERIVVELLVKMGYGGSIAEAGKATKYTNDEGIDGIIKEDKLGLDVIYIQAKRWEGTVPRPEIQKFVGALAGQRAKKGVFITTSNFSKEAISYAGQMDTKIVLIDGEQLAQYMIDYNLGVSVQNTYEIKKLDSDYFQEE
jgi:restriction system protein